MTLQDSNIGWVIINIGHPKTGRQFIVHRTFALTRKEAIEIFSDGHSRKWAYFRRNLNYRAVKAQQAILTLNH